MMFRKSLGEYYFSLYSNIKNNCDNLTEIITAKLNKQSRRRHSAGFVENKIEND